MALRCMIWIPQILQRFRKFREKVPIVPTLKERQDDANAAANAEGPQQGNG